MYRFHAVQVFGRCRNAPTAAAPYFQLFANTPVSCHIVNALNFWIMTSTRNKWNGLSDNIARWLRVWLLHAITFCLAIFLIPYSFNTAMYHLVDAGYCRLLWSKYSSKALLRWGAACSQHIQFDTIDIAFTLSHRLYDGILVARIPFDTRHANWLIILHVEYNNAERERDRYDHLHA